MSVYQDLKDKIENKSVVTGIIGLGYVGLPLAHSVCRQDMRVLGFDIDPAKIEKLNKGESYLDTVPSSALGPHVQKGLLEATDDFGRLGEADILLICVPTPLGKNREPDLSFVENTVSMIAENLRPGQMVVLESTTYPGTLEDVVLPILEKSGLRAEEDFFLAYSPEREDPGNNNFETSSIPKVVGGNSEQGLELACAFYGKFVSKVVPVSCAKTAEAVKITENVFRAVNIALVNELKVIYDRMGIDVWEVIEAASSKPFGYMPFYPGPGLGGHCIPIDPFYLTWTAKEFDVETQFIELAGEINTAMPRYVVEKTKDALQAHAGKEIKGASLLLVGVAYKKNINDQRESPAFPIMGILESLGAQVEYYDPHIPQVMPMRRHPDMTGKCSIAWDGEALGNYDAVVIVTDHDGVAYEDIAWHAKLIVDTRNAMAGQDVAGVLVKA